ncbi:MAG: 4'-phosphopantetheinyl transferase family protein [Candidatus Methylumidiphilus sp.]
MDARALHLWCADPNDLLDADAAQACAALLSAEEKARWQAFRFERHRREYLATRALVRMALSHYHPLPLADWRFPRNAYGKPACDPDCGLRFNVSNTPNLVVCLVAQGREVGVDTEPCDRAADILALAPEVFSPLELAGLETLSALDKMDRALSLWTLKESYIKARGMGLSLPLDKFSFVFNSTTDIALVLDPCLEDKPKRWQFGLLAYAGHRIAFMHERIANVDLQLRPVWLTDNTNFLRKL